MKCGTCNVRLETKPYRMAHVTAMITYCPSCGVEYDRNLFVDLPGSWLKEER